MRTITQKRMKLPYIRIHYNKKANLIEIPQRKDDRKSNYKTNIVGGHVQYKTIVTDF